MPCSIYQRESTNAQKASDISTKTTFYVVDGFVCKKRCRSRHLFSSYRICAAFRSLSRSKNWPTTSLSHLLICLFLMMASSSSHLKTLSLMRRSVTSEAVKLVCIEVSHATQNGFA